MNNYIIIGDSIVYGIGDYETGGWAAMFKKYIVSKDNSKECSNYVHVIGYPGATSSDILSKINYIYNTYKRDDIKNVIILSIGINDTQELDGNNRNSVEKFKENIDKIMKCFLNENAELVVLGLTRIESDEKFWWKPSKYYDNKTICEYDDELIKIAENNKVKYIPMKDVLKKSDYIDGLHPNSKGHKKMFDAIKKEITI